MEGAEPRVDKSEEGVAKTLRQDLNRLVTSGMGNGCDERFGGSAKPAVGRVVIQIQPNS